MSQRLEVSRLPGPGKASGNNEPQIDHADIVIVGNGIAGLTAAVEARRLDPDKRIVIITEQSHPTINTPALKQYAMGKLEREQLLAYPAGIERAQCIHVINASAESISARSKCVHLAGGHDFGYDTLLIATGSKAVGLPSDLPGGKFDGVLTLHRLNDYLDLRRRLSEVGEAVVIGSGPHSIETVGCLLKWGIQVHWHIRGGTFLSHMLDRPASDMVLESMRQAGAKIYTESEVVGIVGRVGVVAGVFTNRNQMIPCQLVLFCTGTTPVTTLAERCDISMRYKRGILVDDLLRTSVRDIYAAGDVAALRDPQTGAFAPRAQWNAAILQGRKVAASMTGSSQGELALPLGVPWHATKLGDLSMLTVGSPLSWADGTTILTDSGKGNYRRLAIVHDRLVGYLSLGATQPDSLAIKRLIDEGCSISEIIKPLLKGDFDARRYFSRQRSTAAHGIVGKLPLFTPSKTEDKSTGQEKVTVELRRVVPPAAVRPDENSQVAAPNTTRKLPVLEPLTASTMQQEKQGGSFKYTEPLAAISQSASPAAELERLHEPLHQPDEQSDSRIVESSLVALPTRASPLVSRSLWSYTDKLPAVEAVRKSFPVEQAGGDSPAEHRESSRKLFDTSGSIPIPPRSTRSRSLWSYTDKVPAIRGGNRDSHHTSRGEPGSEKDDTRTEKAYRSYTEMESH